MELKPLEVTIKLPMTAVVKLSAAEVLVVQVVKSDDVITLVPVPEEATATNKFKLEAQHTLAQLLSLADVLDVQLIPSGDVITRFPVPLLETTTNNDNSGDQQTEVHVLSGVDLPNAIILVL